MLYLSAVPFAELGFPTLGDQNVGHYAEAIMTQTPLIAVSVASLATMMHLILKRRHDVAAFELNQTHHADDAHDQPGGKP